jgi:hypothetical protein
MRVNALKLQYLRYCVTLRVTVLFVLNEEKIKKIRSLKRRFKEEKEQMKMRQLTVQ